VDSVIADLNDAQTHEADDLPVVVSQYAGRAIERLVDVGGRQRDRLGQAPHVDRFPVGEQS
jgi:hypothetical protein